MAVKPKRTAPKKKTSVPKRRRKKPKKTSHSKRNIFIVSALFLVLSLIAFGYFLGQQNSAEHVSDKSVPAVEKIKHKKVLNQKSVREKTPVKKVREIEKKVKGSRVEKERRSNKEKVLLAYRSKRPKLVIIIDDIHTQAQIDTIKALHMKITPSLFPPYASAQKSHLLARGLKHYMIHLPMESDNAKLNKQYKTLKTSFTNKRIQARVKELRTLFPSAKYINNHTGSVFTADYEAMYSLYTALRKEGFVFIDSMTTASSKVKKIAHDFGDAYVARDTFIDNVQTVPAIHKQLTQAVKLAKKNGYAVAIGHPHSVTMKALGSAKNIFKDIDLVYIDEIYR